MYNVEVLRVAAKTALLGLPVAAMYALATPQSSVCVVRFDEHIECFREAPPSILYDGDASLQQRAYQFHRDGIVVPYRVD